jgi:Amt family ammonium transporter
MLTSALRFFRLFLWSAVLALILGMLTAGIALAAPSSQEAATPGPRIDLLASALALCVPIGLAFIVAGGLPEERAREATLSFLAALALGTLGYWAVGFGIQFGGVGLAYDRAGLEGLVWEWSALPPEWGPTWGMVGLRGFGLLREAATPGAYALFLSQLPWAVTAALIPLLALRGRAPASVSLMAGLGTGALLYPLVGNWVWGGGWLANLGENLNLGHGLVDFAGAGTVHLLGAAVALAGILVIWPAWARQTERASTTAEPFTPEPIALAAPPDPTAVLSNGPILQASDASPNGNDPLVPLPPVHLPLLATLGAALLMLGSIGWALANPLVEWAVVPAVLAALNVLLAAAGGAALPLAYTWFTASRPDPLMAARGLAAGVIAASAAGPLMPPWAALGVGAVAGLLVPFVLYATAQWLRWDDRTAAVATSGLGGLWGLISVGLFADGRWGQGWNRIGVEQFLGIAQQGVTGLLAAPGFHRDWPGQMQAQLIGAAVIALFCFVAAWLIFAVVSALARALLGSQ